jgi:hypothetical protein
MTSDHVSGFVRLFPSTPETGPRGDRLAWQLGYRPGAGPVTTVTVTGSPSGGGPFVGLAWPTCMGMVGDAPRLASGGGTFWGGPSARGFIRRDQAEPERDDGTPALTGLDRPKPRVKMSRSSAV